VTQKGKGYARRRPRDKYHAVFKFDVATGTRPRPSERFLRMRTCRPEPRQAKPRRREIVGITARMPSGPASTFSNKAFPDRLSTRHAEQQEGDFRRPVLRPRATSRSAHLFDLPAARPMTRSSMTSDPELPVRFAIDRASVAPTAPPSRLVRQCLSRCCQFSSSWRPPTGRTGAMVATQVAINDRPSAVRYPRGEGRGVEIPSSRPAGDRKRPHRSRGQQIALLSLGTRLAECEKAADELAAHGLSTPLPTRVS